MSDGKGQNTAGPAGGGYRVRDVIAGPQKPVYWTNRSGTEHRNRTERGEPEAMTLANGER